MTTLLSAERVKLTNRRLPWVLGGILVLLTIVGAFFQFLAVEIFDDPSLTALDVPEQPEAYLYGFLNAAGSTWVPVILAVVMLGGEFSRGTWAVSLTWESRRWLQLVARLVVIGLGAVVLGLIGVVVWGVFAAVFADGSGLPQLGDIVLATIKLGYVQFVWVAVGLAAAALIRSTGLAVGLAVGLTFVEQLLAIWPAYQDFSIGSASSGLFGLELPVVVGSAVGLPDPTRSAAILLVWGAISLGVAWASLQYRDA